MAERTDVVVAGGGVVGCAVAYYLSLEGARVHLLDMEAIGSGASAHATGLLSLSGGEFSPGASFRLGLEGYRMFADLVPRLQEETGMDLLCQRRPAARLALDEDEEAFIKGMMAWQREESLPIQWITRDEVRQLEPRLTPRVRGAAYEEESVQLDSYRLNLALAQAAERHGTRVQLRQVTGLETEGQRVTGVRCKGETIHCDTVALATGSWSSVASQWLRFPVPVRPLKGERLMLRYDGEPLPFLITSPRRGHLISRLDGLLSVGSTGGRDYDRAERFLGEEYDRRPTEAARLELLQRAVDVLPALEDAAVVQQLAGSRPLSPDRMPIIGPVPGWEGVMLATGHGTKGIHLAPITGKVLADLILRGKTDVPVPLEPFLPARFAQQGVPSP